MAGLLGASIYVLFGKGRIQRTMLLFLLLLLLVVVVVVVVVVVFVVCLFVCSFWG
jgi:hypothetical protein